MQLVFESKPASKQYNAERMWVRIARRDRDDFWGELVNSPLDMPQLAPGDQIRFKISDVIDIDWDTEALTERGLQHSSRRTYLERCLVDKCVLDDGVPVGYIYREEAETPEGDKYQDSGWRIRGDVNRMTQEQYDIQSPMYVAIGKVLNADDRWIDLIDAPVGSRFIRNDETDCFEPLED